MNADEMLGANYDLLSYNLYAYVSNNPIFGIDNSGQGFFSAVGRALNNIRTFVDHAKRKVEKFVSDSIKKLISVNVNECKNTSGPVYQVGSFGKSETGTSTSSSLHSYGGDNSFITIDVNTEKDKPWDTTIGISVGNSFISSSYEIGLNSFEQSIGLNIQDKIYSVTNGRNGIYSYTGANVKTPLIGNSSNSSYFRVNVNFMWPIAIYGILTGILTFLPFAFAY